MGRFVHRFKWSPTLLIVGLPLLFLLIALMSLFRPIIASYLIQSVHHNDSAVYWIYLLICFQGGLLALLGIRAFLYTHFELKLLSYLQNLVMNKLLTLPVDFFDKFTTGDLVQRVLWINPLSQLFSINQMGVLLSFLSLLVSFSVLFYFNWQLTLVVFILVFFTLIIAIVSAVRITPSLEHHANDMGRAYGFLWQVLNSMSRIKLFARQAYIEQTWDSLYSQSRMRLGATYQRGILGYAFFNSIPLLILFIIFVLSWSQSFSAQKDNLVLFLLALCSLLASIVGFYLNAGSIVEALIAYRRVQPILNAPSETIFLKSQELIKEPIEHIHFNHVFFAYPNSSRLIVRDVQCSIRRGQHVALVGLSGSGKSTLIKLLLGLYTPQQGCIMINNRILTGNESMNLRYHMGIAVQDGQLLNGTILENIVGHHDAGEHDAWMVLERIGCEPWVSSLPKGIHTLVSQHVNLLSDGQKQMILLARALMGNPELLILDEATNCLDDTMHEWVCEQINQLPMTRITIAHRITSVKKVDKIFVMNQGALVEEGTYEQLMREKGLFYQLASC